MINIFTCIKQVPSSNEVYLDPITNNLIRDARYTKLNPCDQSALEFALQIKDNYLSNLSVITMGPKSATDIITYSYSLGVDHGYLLSDSQFAGADTYATAKTLASALNRYPYDLIICGKFSIDGDTGQVGPSLATNLAIPHIYNVKKLISCDDEQITIQQAINNKLVTTTIKYPVLLVVDNIYHIRAAKLSLKLKAKNKAIDTITLADLSDLNESNVGFKGSLTQVKKIYIPKVESKEVLKSDDYEYISNEINNLLVGNYHE